jgi:hypothetical protein
MTPITDIVDYLMIYCPHCKTGQFVTEWGTKTCRYEKCGKNFDVFYDPELLLKEAIQMRKDNEKLMKRLIPKQRKPAVLQKYLTGSWVLVPQGPENH